MKLDPILPLPLLILFLLLFSGFAIYLLIQSRERWPYKITAFVLGLSILILTFVVGLRPMKEDYNSEIRLSNLDVLFVLDTTVSMWADDNPKGTRIDSARADIRMITDTLAGANFALITFDNSSFIRSPFTQDTDTLFSILDSISMPSPYTTIGTNLNTPHKDIESLLVSSSKKANHRAIVFFLSDGEITSSANRLSYESFASFISGGAVLGYGTADGGRMKTDYGYLFDYTTGRDAVSSIDEEMLSEIAGELNIPYLRMDTPNSLAPVLTLIQAGGDTLTERHSGIVSYRDTYYLYVIPLLLLLSGVLGIFIRLEKKRCTTS